MQPKSVSDFQIKSHVADSDAYNDGRAEGRADVISAIRSVMPPVMEKADADAVLRAVANVFRCPNAPALPPIGSPSV